MFKLETTFYIIKTNLDKIKNKNFSENELLALLSASSVLRKEKYFKELLYFCKKKKINGEKIYETILQTYLFAGYPSALISLQIVNRFFPKKITVKNSHTKLDTIKKGTQTCKKIYGNKFNKLINNIKSFSPELADWLIIEGYGKVLSRKGLTLAERELSIISILTVLKYGSQLYSHINGAVRQKVSKEKIKKVIENLELLGNKSYTKYGMRVFSKFISDKINPSNSD